MKRLITVVSAIVLTVSVYAQTDSVTTTKTVTQTTPVAPPVEPQPQSPSESKLHFGLKAAPALAWLRTDSPNLQSDGSRFGFSYGLITEFRFAPNYAFATGIDVTYRGGKFKSEEKSGDTTTVKHASFNLQYIEIPITLKLKTNEIGSLVYFLQAGIAPGFNIRAKGDVDSTSTASNYSSYGSKTNVDVKDDINNFNLSMIIGGGIEYTMTGSTVLLVGLQFNNGFLDVFDTGDKVNSNYLALTVGVLF